MRMRAIRLWAAPQSALIEIASSQSFTAVSLPPTRTAIRAMATNALALHFPEPRRLSGAVSTFTSKTSHRERYPPDDFDIAQTK
jgi:hypothetical protein